MSGETYLVAKKIVSQAEDGRAFVASEDAAFPLDVELLNLSRARVKFVNLSCAQRLGGGKQDVHFQK